MRCNADAVQNSKMFLSQHSVVITMKIDQNEEKNKPIYTFTFLNNVTYSLMLNKNSLYLSVNNSGNETTTFLTEIEILEWKTYTFTFKPPLFFKSAEYQVFCNKDCLYQGEMFFPSLKDSQLLSLSFFKDMVCSVSSVIVFKHVISEEDIGYISSFPFGISTENDLLEFRKACKEKTNRSLLNDIYLMYLPNRVNDTAIYDVFNRLPATFRRYVHKRKVAGICDCPKFIDHYKMNDCSLLLPLVEFFAASKRLSVQSFEKLVNSFKLIVELDDQKIEKSLAHCQILMSLFIQLENRLMTSSVIESLCDIFWKINSVSLDLSEKVYF